MHWSYGAWGWLGWLSATVVTVGFWALVIWLVVSWVRPDDRVRDRAVDRDEPASGPRAEQVLAERFAAGEIDEDEYRSHLDVLRSTKAGVS